jgi:hypothetical protein
MIFIYYILFDTYFLKVHNAKITSILKTLPWTYFFDEKFEN